MLTRKRRRRRRDGRGLEKGTGLSGISEVQRDGFGRGKERRRTGVKRETFASKLEEGDGREIRNKGRKKKEMDGFSREIHRKKGL